VSECETRTSCRGPSATRVVVPKHKKCMQYIYINKRDIWSVDCFDGRDTTAWSTKKSWFKFYRNKRFFKINIIYSVRYNLHTAMINTLYHTVWRCVICKKFTTIQCKGSDCVVTGFGSFNSFIPERTNSQQIRKYYSYSVLYSYTNIYAH
jgi:hypothetical protein